MNFCRKIKKQLFVHFAVLFFTAVLLTSAQAIEITLYTSSPAEVADLINKAFMKANPDISVNMFRSGTGTVMGRVFTEARAEKIVPDILHVADPSVFVDLKQRGWLLPYKTDSLDYLADLGMADPQGYYFVGRLLVPVLVWKAKTPSPGISQWEDLVKIASPNLGIPNPTGYGTMMNLYFYMHFRLGEEKSREFWLTLRKKDVHFGDWASGLKATIAGEKTYGVTLDDQAERAREREGIQILYPNPTPLVNAPMALISQGKNDPEKIAAAKKFIDFWLGREAQQILVDNYLLSPRKDVKYPEGRTPLDKISLGKIDSEASFKIKTKLVEWWQQNM